MYDLTWCHNSKCGRGIVVYRYNAIGTAFAGLPFIFVGHNEKIGWGMTQAGSDVQDLYVLAKSGDGYTLDGSTKAFETRALDEADCLSRKMSLA